MVENYVISEKLREALSFYSRELAREDVSVDSELRSGSAVSGFSLWALLVLVFRVSYADAVKREDSVHAEQVLSFAEPVLHMRLDEAVAICDGVPGAVRSVYGVWGNSNFSSWLESASVFLPVGFEVPSKEELDSWVVENTDGLISEFPIDVDAMKPDLIVANALVSSLRWVEPFDVVDSSSGGCWSVPSMLSQSWGSLSCPVTVLKGVQGDFLMFNVEAEGGKFVKLFVPSLSTRVDEADLYDFMVSNFDSAGSLLDSDMQLSEFGWGVSEKVLSASDSVYVVLPAWTVEGEKELSEVGSICEALDAVFPGDDWEGKQVVKAVFGKDGFKAAALTGLYMYRASMPLMEERVHHKVSVPAGFGFVVVEHGVPLFAGTVGSEDATHVDG